MSSFEMSAMNYSPSVCARNGAIYEVISSEILGDVLSVIMRQTREDGTVTAAAREWDITEDFYHELDSMADDMYLCAV